MSAPKHYHFWIDNKDVAAADGAKFEHKYPADLSQIVYTLEWGTREDARKAIRSSRAAFDSGVWSKKSVSERNAVLTKAVDLVRQNKDRLAAMLMRETGRPLPFCYVEMDVLPSIFEYNMGLALTLPGDTNTRYNPKEATLIIHEPVGVVGGIVPWNFPILLLSQKAAPALASGCTLVLKPSEFTAGTAIEIAKLFAEAGVPPGVFNVVTGPGEEVGDELAANELVDKVSFTGSIRAGKSVMKSAASNLKKVTLECGGKSPNFVFEDADLDSLVKNPGFILSLVMHAGQVCALGSRILVQESIKDKFLEKLVPVLQAIGVGRPDDPEVLKTVPFTYGAVTNQKQLETILNYIEVGKKEGAKVVTGGHRLTGGAYDQGLFIAPTVFDGVAPNMRIAQEEIFGPVVAVIPFKTVDEAITIANSTIMGLEAVIWTNNINTVFKVSKEVRAGHIMVNTFSAPAPNSPFGGMKASGLGREGGIEGFLAYMETKAIQIALP